MSKKKKTFDLAIISLSFSINNMIASFADESGNILCWASAGSSGFRSSSKSSPNAVEKTITEAARKFAEHYLTKQIVIKITSHSTSSPKEVAIKKINSLNIGSIYSIEDTISIPHNGCRPPKRRRI